MPIPMHERFWFRAAEATAFAVLAAIVGPQSASAGMPTGARPVTIGGSSAPVAAPQHHLYVLNEANAAVYRFPLAPDGLPDAKPDGVLVLDGAKGQAGLAVDHSGHVFVADAVLQVVNEYAAGATGPQEPMSTLNLPGDAPEHLKMDSAERLYVEYGSASGGQFQAIAIFPKGAQGTNPPMSVIEPACGSELLVDYVIAPSGTLYVLAWSMCAPIVGYDHPLHSPPKPDVFMWLQGPGGEFGEFDAGYSMAFDDASSQLYFQFLPEFDGYDMDFAVRKVPYSGYPTQRDSTIYSHRCPAQYGDSGGAVVVKAYLIVSCVFNSEVLVYRRDLFGIRQPVEIIRGPLLAPGQIAVGP